MSSIAPVPTATPTTAAIPIPTAIAGVIATPNAPLAIPQPIPKSAATPAPLIPKSRASSFGPLTFSSPMYPVFDISDTLPFAL